MDNADGASQLHTAKNAYIIAKLVYPSPLKSGSSTPMLFNIVFWWWRFVVVGGLVSDVDKFTFKDKRKRNERKRGREKTLITFK